MRTLRRPHLPDEQSTYCTAHPDMWSAAPNAGTHTSGARQVRRRGGVELARGGQPVLPHEGYAQPASMEHDPTTTFSCGVGPVGGCHGDTPTPWVGRRASELLGGDQMVMTHTTRLTIVSAARTWANVRSWLGGRRPA